MNITKRKLDEGREDDEFPDSPLELQELSGDELEDSDICSSEDSGVEESNVRSDEEASMISLPGKVTSSKKHDEDDTSDEEDIRNSVGNIPMKWYEKFPHIGYNLDGKKILKPIRNLDELDKFLDKMDNPDHWKTVYDETTGRNHIMTPEEISLIGRLTSGKFYDSSIDPYAPYLDFFTNEKMIHPLTNAPEHKRSFIPSLQEKQKVGKLVHAIKMGWLKPRKEKKEEDEQPKFYDLWQEEKEDPLTHSQIARRKMHIPAPKPKLPGHDASYNPPLEYLPTEEEKLAWEQEDPEDRKTNFLPQKYDCLRKVPQYSNFIQDAFARCLDLYLCPRQRKMRVNVDPEDLIPKLPKPSDLQPFPTRQALCYNGHENIVRSISVDASGQWIASGSDDKTIRVWEVSTGRCIRIITVSEVVKCVSWCPNASVCLLAASVGENILIINPYVGDRVKCQATDQLLHSYEEKIEKDSENPEENTAKQIVNWQIVEPGKDFKEGIRIVLNHGKPVSKVTWHSKGDYFASTLPGNGHNQVLLHQLTKRRSQNPFSKTKGMVQCVLFHPHRPFLLVATQKFVRIYNLVKQILSKKLIVGVQWISCMAIHPKGDDVLIGSYDCRLSWFDMDLSVKPYQTLRYHTRAIRACAYHNRYPLFASASDDGSIVVSHGMVYSDLLQNPLIVPVKVLKGHKVERNLGVLDCCFHPTQPWIFSSAADNTIRLYT